MPDPPHRPLGTWRNYGLGEPCSVVRIAQAPPRRPRRRLDRDHDRRPNRHLDATRRHHLLDRLNHRPRPQRHRTASRLSSQPRSASDDTRSPGQSAPMVAAVIAAVSQEELEAAHCWLDHDRVPGRPELTEFRRAVRYHHAKWRDDNGYPIGTHRTRPGAPPRLVGSHLDLEFAGESGASFLTAKAVTAARDRTSYVEPHQNFYHQGFWADLLSSEALAVNLFGDLAADLDRADRAVHAWWPETPGRVTAVRFAHSPGRFDPSYSNSLRSFDACFVVSLPDGSDGALAIDVKYREAQQRQGVKPTHLPRFVEIHD